MINIGVGIGVDKGTTVAGGTPAPPAFLPTDVAELVHWLNAEDIDPTVPGPNVDPDGVYLFEDGSTSENDATQATGAHKPDLALLNSLQAIQGDGNDDEMDFGSTLTIAGDFSLWWAFRFVTLAEQQFLVGHDPSNFIAVSTAGQLLVRLSSAVNLNLSATSAFAIDTDYVLAIHRDGSDNLTAVLNGSDITSGTPSSAGNFNGSVILSRSSGVGSSSVSNLILGEWAAFSAENDADTKTSMTSYMARWLP